MAIPHFKLHFQFLFNTVNKYKNSLIESKIETYNNVIFHFLEQFIKIVDVSINYDFFGRVTLIQSIFFLEVILLLERICRIFYE